VNRRIPLIAGALVAAIAICWYLAFWRPAGGQFRAAQASELTAQAQQARLNTELASLISVQRQLPALEAQLRSSAAAVPTADSINTIIDQIDADAIADGISWTNESQSSAGATATSAGGSTTLGLTLAVAGSYPNMLHFLAALVHQPRLIVIDSLVFTPAAGDQVTVAVTGRTFYDSTPLPKLPKG
jgi:Tfp pilus assembly protein PilO